MRQGRLAEAEAAARRAVTVASGYFGRNSGQTGEALGTLTEVLAEQGRPADTVALAQVTLDVYRQMGAEPDSITMAAIRRALADALVASGDWPGALAEYSAIERDLAARPDDIEFLFQFNLTWALPRIAAGDPTDALERLRRVRDRLHQRIGAQRYESAEAEGLIAAAHSVLGDDEAALGHYRSALEVLLERANQSDSEEQTSSGRALRLRFILEHYLQTLFRQGSAGDIEEGFRIANVIRASRVDEALAAAAARAAVTDPALAELARTEQTMLLRIKALNGLLAQSGSRGDTDAELQRQLLTRLATLKSSRKSVIEQIAEQFPDYARLIDPRPARVTDIRRVLHDDEALVATYIARDHTYVWALRKSGPVHHAVAELGARKIAGIVTRLRGALEPDVQSLGDLPPFNLRRAHTLYAELLAPVAAGWRDAQQLIIIPHGALGSLPFALLPTEEPAEIPAEIGDDALLFAGYRGVPWLIRSHAVSRLPSASSLLALRAAKTSGLAELPFVGFGDPIFDAADSSTAVAGGTRSFGSSLRAVPRTRAVNSAALQSLPRLPDTAEEILNIARVVGADLERDVFLQRDANEARVKRMSAAGELRRYRVLSFATHGLVPGDLDGLMQPALALSSPQAAGVEGDGLLDMTEILGLELNADWAVLSACNTAAADGAGAEAVSGLGRAFFYAGTRALLVSNWPVHSAATTYLMSDVFERYAASDALPKAQALRQAMLTAIDEGAYTQDGEALFSYAHPIFWAPFTLVGDGAI